MLCFRRMSDNILKGMKAIDPNKDDVIEAAAKLIKDDIRNMSCRVPITFTLINMIFSGNKKVMNGYQTHYKSL